MSKPDKELTYNGNEVWNLGFQYIFGFFEFAFSPVFWRRRCRKEYSPHFPRNLGLQQIFEAKLVSPFSSKSDLSQIYSSIQRQESQMMGIFKITIENAAIKICIYESTENFFKELGRQS